MFDAILARPPGSHSLRRVSMPRNRLPEWRPLKKELKR